LLLRTDKRLKQSVDVLALVLRIGAHHAKRFAAPAAAVATTRFDAGASSRGGGGGTAGGARNAPSPAPLRLAFAAAP